MKKGGGYQKDSVKRYLPEEAWVNLTKKEKKKQNTPKKKFPKKESNM